MSTLQNLESASSVKRLYLFCLTGDQSESLKRVRANIDRKDLVIVGVK